MNDNDTNAEIYTDLLRRHGDSYRSLGWGSEKKQALRFKILSEIGDLREQSVLDVGCGLSHFYRYLNRKGVTLDYTGLDITPAMVDRSADLFPECKFLVGDLLSAEVEPQGYDYVMANGIFVFRKTDPQKYMFDTVEAMFRLAKKGIAFSCLSAWADQTTDGEFHADPIRVVEFCRDLSRYVTLRHDYHPADFIIYVKKDES